MVDVSEIVGEDYIGSSNRKVALRRVERMMG